MFSLFSFRQNIRSFLTDQIFDFPLHSTMDFLPNFKGRFYSLYQSFWSSWVYIMLASFKKILLLPYKRKIDYRVYGLLAIGMYGQRVEMRPVPHLPTYMNGSYQKQLVSILRPGEHPTIIEPSLLWCQLSILLLLMLSDFMFRNKPWCIHQSVTRIRLEATWVAVCMWFR